MGDDLEGNCGKHGHALGLVLSEQDTPMRRTQPVGLQFAICGLVQLPQHTSSPQGPEWVLVALGLTVRSQTMSARMGAVSRAMASGKATPSPGTPQSQESEPQGSGKQPRFSHCAENPWGEVGKLNLLPTPK